MGWVLRLAALGAALGLLGLVGAVALVAGALSSSASSGALVTLAEAAQSCAVSGPVRGLSGEQAANAEVVVSTAMADSAEDALTARIALMVAYSESALRDLGPMSGNAGSLGLFQQRASQGWGSASEEMNPAEATAMFVGRLTRVRTWRSRPPWLVAQDVQRSAFADGSNYRTNWPLAGSLLAAVLTNANVAGGCGQGPSGGLVGPASAHGLPVGYAIPPGTPPGHALAVAFALAELGHPYVWGAAGPVAFDCSGLTEKAWAVAGVALLHYTVDQLHEGQAVAPASAVPGDLVLIPGSDPPGPGLPGHVGIYLGDGLVVSAVDPQMGVIVQSWQVFVSGGLDAVVDPAPGR
jgi:cell wall-associated NlpC family hydrolase